MIAPLRGTLLAMVLGLCSSPLGCAPVRPPDQLVELRAALEEGTIASGREAAPDLVSEAQRSLGASEAAFERGDEGRAAFQAELGLLQAALARTAARAQTAQQREATASASVLELEQRLARFRSQRQDALAEVARLERATPDQSE